MGLRLAEGVDLSVLAARFGLTAEELCNPAKLAFYAHQGLAWQDGPRIGVSEAGMPLLDGLLGELVPAELVES
jgi:oxygen-independent coproporphyrinogen-3 oxidase